MKHQSLCLLFFISIFYSSFQFRVGFFTANIENSKVTAEEFDTIKNSFEAIAAGAKVHILTAKEFSEPKTKQFDTFYDAILFSFQEAHPGTSLDYFVGLLDTKVWACERTLHKTGVTKLTMGRVKTISRVCYKKSIFKVTYIKDGSANLLDIADTKDTLVTCLQKTSKDLTHYCLGGGHLDTSLDKSLSDTVKTMINKVKEGVVDHNKKNKISSNDENVITYLVGDLNTRSWQSVANITVLEKAIKYNLDNAFGRTNPDANLGKSILQGDQDAISYYQTQGAKLVSDFQIKFVGVNAIRKLPFTYKYNDPNGDNDDQIDEDDFDYKKMFETKTGAKDKEVHNFGWLDRMLCVHNTKKNKDCKVNENSVAYFGIPALRKADHLPIIGHIEISDSVKRRRRLKKF